MGIEQLFGWEREEIDRNAAIDMVLWQYFCHNYANKVGKNERFKYLK